MRSIWVPVLAAILALHATTACAAPAALRDPSAFANIFADLAEKVRPAVVNISTTMTVDVPKGVFLFFEPDPGERGKELPDRKIRQQSLGTGVIIDPNGLILTNNHMLEKADEIRVTLSDGREFLAEVAGRDPKTDLALIKIVTPCSDLPTLLLGDSDKVRVGEWVVAVGNPFGLEHTVTQGIISATGRVIGSGPYDQFLQSDAAINPGNSGGPLINIRGEVIGINTAIASRAQGIGFAIPSNLAKSVAAQLKEKGRVVRGWIGVSAQSLTQESASKAGLTDVKGVLVADVVQKGPAAKGGILPGDVIVTFDGRRIVHSSDLPRFVAETPVGKTVTVQVIRKTKRRSVEVTVAEMK